MTGRIIPSDTLSFVEELRQDRKKNADFWYERANKATNEQQFMINMTNCNMNANFGTIYGMIKYTMETINTMDSLIEKLEEKSADKDEVRVLRTELTTKVNETLVPIKDEIEKQKELDKRTSDAGIQ
jgi:hypothetical protein